MSIRLRLVAIAIAVASPLLMVNALQLLAGRDDARRAAGDETGRIAAAVAAAFDQTFLGAREALVAIASDDEVRDLDPGSCSAALATLLPQYPGYVNLAATDRDGDLVCSAVPPSGPVSLADRNYFRRAVEHDAFAIGEYSLGRVSGQATIVVALPIHGPDLAIRGIVLASIPLRTLDAVVDRLDLPTGASVTVVDREGTILVRRPDPEVWVGRQPLDAPIIGAILAGTGRGAGGSHGAPAELVGIDGVLRLYAVEGVGDGGDVAVHVAIGYALDQAYATADGQFAIGMIAVAVAALIAVALAWWVARSLIVAPIERLSAVARRLTVGDLGARTGLAGGGEFGRLAGLFDDMAESVQDRVEARTADLATARAEAEQARVAAESARAEAERANASKTEFLSRMSHELRTPLNAVIGFAQLLEMDDLSREQRESVHQVLAGGRHLLELINEVLDISRIESRTLSISLEPVSVREAARDVAEMIEPLARDAGVVVDAVALPGEAYVHADRQRLRQVLLNLLSNAVKYSRRGGHIRLAARSVEAERSEASATLRFEIIDEGPGIEPAMVERVFAPFDRLGAERSGVEGTGLGLALSKALVEAMGGRIGVESEVGRGSTFWFELSVVEPAAVAPEHAAGTATPAIVPEPPTVAGSRKLLYIEDNPSNLRLVERALGRRPAFRLYAAMLGSLGLDLAIEHRPDVILLDLHLPDLSGEDVLVRLRAEPATASIPVVVLSAEASERVRERLRALGADAYLPKPIDLAELYRVIDSLTASAGDEDAP